MINYSTPSFLAENRLRVAAWLCIASLGLACNVGSKSATSSRQRGGEDAVQGVVELDDRLLSFEVSGKIDRVAVKRGDVVKKGDVIAEVDATLEKLTRDVRADDVKAANADLALLEAGSRKEDVSSLAAQMHAAEATEGLLEKQLVRARSLRDSQSISQAELDRSEAELARAKNERSSLAERLQGLRRGARTEELARARARAAGAESALALQDARLERFVVRAGADGSVLDVHVEPGELAAPGAPVVSVADLAHPRVDVFVPEAKMPNVAIGKSASVFVDGLPAPVKGSVEHIGTRTEFTPNFIFSDRERPNLVVRVRIRVDDPERKLRAGMPAFVRID